MASSTCYSEVEGANNLFPCIAPKEREGEARCGELTALSVEFVAKAHDGARSRSAVGEAVERGLQDAAGFAGSLVLAADEAQGVMTAITFWGDGRGPLRKNREAWVQKALAAHVEHCLHVGWFQASAGRADLFADARGTGLRVKLG